jgi:hypothetical protein
MKQEDMALAVASWWPHAADPEFTSVPKGWQWGAHPRFTLLYKHLLLDTFCYEQAQALRNQMSSTSFEAFFMSLAFEDDSGSGPLSEGLAFVRQNALACTKFEESCPKLQQSAIDAFVADLSKPEIGESRTRLLETCNVKGGIFSSIDEDSSAEEHLYSLVCRSVAPVLEAHGFTTDKLGLHVFLALAKAHVAGCKALLEESITCLLHGGKDRFEFVPSPHSNSSIADVDVSTLVIAFSSMGSGLVRPEFRGSLRNITSVDKLFVIDPAYSWYMQDPGCSWTGFEFYEHKIKEYIARGGYKRVAMLGDSMGGSAALLFSHLATNVCSFVPQIDLVEYVSATRDDLTTELRGKFTQALLQSVSKCKGSIAVHVGQYDDDMRQLDALPACVERRVHPYHDHLVSSHLKTAGELTPLVQGLVGEDEPLTR